MNLKKILWQIPIVVFVALGIIFTTNDTWALFMVCY